MEESDDQIEELLSSAGQMVRALESDAAVPAPSLAKKAAFLKSVCQAPASEVSLKQLETVILTMLTHQGLSGLEVARMLENFNVVCKAMGDGAVHALLNQMESRGDLQCRWRESGQEMLKFYHITSKGEHRLEHDKSGVSASLLTMVAEAQ